MQLRSRKNSSQNNTKSKQRIRTAKISLDSSYSSVTVQETSPKFGKSGIVKQHQIKMISSLYSKSDADEFMRRTQEQYKALEKLQEVKENKIEKIFLMHQQQQQGSDQIKAVQEDISSKKLQNYDLMVEYEDLQNILNQYLENEKDNGQNVHDELLLKQKSKQISQNIKVLKLQIQQIQEEDSLFQLSQDSMDNEQYIKQKKQNLSQMLSDLGMKLQKDQRELTDIKTRQDLLHQKINDNVQRNCEQMLKYYINEKVQQLKNIRNKYGRLYYEKLITEVRYEFKELFQNELKNLYEKFKKVVKRLFVIESVVQKNNSYIDLLIKDLDQFKYQLKYIPNALSYLKLEVSNIIEQEEQQYQNIENVLDSFKENIPTQETQQRSIYSELQQLKNSILILEEKLIQAKGNGETQNTFNQIKQLKLQFSQLQTQNNKSPQNIHKKVQSCTQSNLSSVTTSRDKTPSRQQSPIKIGLNKQITTPILSKNMAKKPKNLSLAQVIPSINIELYNNTPISIINPQELLQSINKNQDEPRTIGKKQQQLSSYQLSFNTNPINPQFKTQISQVEHDKSTTSCTSHSFFENEQPIRLVFP